MESDGVQEDSADAELRNPSEVRRYHWRNWLRRAGTNRKVRERRRIAGDTGKRFDAGAGRWNRSRSAARGGWRATQLARRRRDGGGRITKRGDADTGRACEGKFRPAGAPDCLRLSGADLRVPAEFSFVRCAAALAAN